MPSSTIHMHQAMGGAQGQASDIEIEAREAIRINDKLRHILATNTGQDEERIRRDFDRNFYMTAQQAKEYGVSLLGVMTAVSFGVKTRLSLKSSLKDPLYWLDVLSTQNS